VECGETRKPAESDNYMTLLQLFEKIIIPRTALQADKLCTLISDFMTSWLVVTEIEQIEIQKGKI